MRGKRKQTHWEDGDYLSITWDTQPISFISPIVQRFHFHVFTLPTLRSETLHPDSECLSCEVYTRFHFTFLENHWPSLIGMICVVKGIERGWWWLYGCSNNETETRRRLQTIRGTRGEDNVNKGELVEYALKISERGIHPGVNGECVR